MPAADRWVTVADAAELMGCGKEAARRRLKDVLRTRKHNGRDCMMAKLSRVRAAITDNSAMELGDPRCAVLLDDIGELRAAYLNYVEETEARLYRIERLLKIGAR